MGDSTKQLLISGAIGFATGGIGFAAGSFNFTMAAAIKGAVVSMALTAASKALAPKPPSIGLQDQKRTVTIREPNATRKLIYGETRIGGNIVHIQSTNDDEYLHMVIVMAAHEIESFESIYFNDDELTISNNVTTAPDKFDGLVKIHQITKGTVSDIPADLISDTGWTADHVLTDQAYIYVRLKYDADAFPSGIPNISAVVRGRKVYDTRSSTTAWSRNPAMILRDYLMDTTYGLGATADEIDESSFIAAANLCDEQVALDGGGNENRYYLDGRVDTGQTPKSNIEDLLTAMNGALYYVNGRWAVRAGAYDTPTVTLDEDDLAGGMSITTAISARDSFNAIKGQFVSPETEYQPSDYPEITSSTFESEDNSERRYMNLDLPYTTSSSMAQRIAKQILYRNRQEITITARFKLTAFQFQVGDTIMITNSRLGFSNKPFEVVNWQLAFTNDEVAIDCVLTETNSSVYAWNAEETAFQQDNTTLPSGGPPPAPTNLTLTATAVVNDDGITIPAIQVDWDVVAGGFVQYYEVQYKRLGGEEDYGSITVSQTESENWGSIIDAFTSEEDYGLTNEPVLTPDDQYASNVGTTNSFTIIPVLNGYDYNVRVRAINSFGARSAFATSVLASLGDTTPPGTPLALAANGMYKSIEISWTNPADQDLDYVEIWENTVDNINTAQLIGTSASTNFIRGNLGNNVQKYYWVRAVDLSLNKSDFTSSVNDFTSLVEPNDFSDAVNDLFQEAGAFGIEPVDALPTSGSFDGQIVLLKTDITLYRWDDATSSWSTDLYTASNVEAGTITAASFASGIEPVSIVSTLPSPTGYTGPSIVFLTTDSKLYRYNGTAWTAAVSTQDLSGELGEGLFPENLRPIERVTSLPTTSLTQGRIVLLTTDNKLYRYTGNEWTADLAATNITGQIVGVQISDDAITASKIATNAVTADAIAANSIESDAIQANAITAAKITSGAISADKIATNAITAGKIATDAITAGTIAAGAINASDLFVSGVIQADAIGTGAIISDKIAAGSILASKIGTGAITADKISVGAITADKIGANEIGITQIAPSLESANYVPDESGWRITKDGIIEISDLQARGVIEGSTISGSSIVGSSIQASTIFVSDLLYATEAGDPYYANNNQDFLISVVGPTQSIKDGSHNLATPEIPLYSFSANPTTIYDRFRRENITMTVFIDVASGGNTRDAVWYGQQGTLKLSNGSIVCQTSYYNGSSLSLFDDRTGTRVRTGSYNGALGTCNWTLTSIKSSSATYGAGWWTIQIDYNFDYSGDLLFLHSMYLNSWSSDFAVNVVEHTFGGDVDNEL